MRKRYAHTPKSVVIKIGTSILTKNGHFDKTMISELAAQVSILLKKGIRVCLVSSGAIGSGMTILGLKERPSAMEGLQAAAAVGQRYLMQCYEEAFSRKGFSTAQVLLTWGDLAEKQRFLNAKRTINQIQKWGLVPIINENDTVATEEIRFGDNDHLSSLLAILVEADLQIILSDTDGLYEAGRKNDPASRISQVVESDDSIFRHVKDSKKSFTVGGMGSKLKAIRMSTRAGIPVFLVNGRLKGVLSRVFEGEDVGTFFLPSEKKKKVRDGWIRHFVSHIQK